MKTAHQILSEATMSNRLHEKESKEWSHLVRECRTSRLLAVVWLGVFGFFALVGAILAFKHLGDFSLIFMGPLAFLAITSPLIFTGQNRRERALFALIAREAPELSRKLKADGIG